jgi:hypothetical protein
MASWYQPTPGTGGMQMGDYAPSNPYVGQFDYGGRNWQLFDPSQNYNANLPRYENQQVYKGHAYGGGGQTEGFFIIGPDGKPQQVHSDFNTNPSWGDDFRSMAPVLMAAALGAAGQYGLLGQSAQGAFSQAGMVPWEMGLTNAMPGAAAGVGGAASGMPWGGSEELFLQNPALGPGAQAGVGAGAGAVGGIPATGAGAGFEGLMPGNWNPGNFTGVPPSSGLPSTSPSAPPGAPGTTPPTPTTPGAPGTTPSAPGLLGQVGGFLKDNPWLAGLLGAGLGAMDGSKVEDLYGGRKTAIDRLNANRLPAGPWGRY